MSATEPPEKARNKASQGAGSMPDLLIRESDMSTDAPSENEKSDANRAESVFSTRSGIQDLIKVPSEPEEAVQEKPLASPEEETEPKPGRPPARKKGKATRKKGNKLAKSKRELDRARHRQMNYLQKRREKKKMRVFYGRIRTVFKLFFAVLWGILLWELMHSSLWNFNPPTFTLTTSRSVQASQLTDLVKSWGGKPLYAVDTGKLADQIEARFDLVDRAVVRRQLFPASLEIQLFEKQPWAQLYIPAVYEAFQKKEAEQVKVAIEKAKAPTKPAEQKPSQPESKPLLKPYAVAADDQLISMTPYKYDPALFANTEKILVNPRTTLKKSYLNRLRELAWQARQIPGYHLESVDIRNPQQVILRFQEIPVILGTLNLSATERLSRLAPLKAKIQEYRDVIESVDLQWEEQVTFHKRPNAQFKKPKSEQVQG